MIPSIRYTTGGGFLFADPEFLSTDHNDEEREKYLESLWNEVCQHFAHDSNPIEVYLD